MTLVRDSSVALYRQIGDRLRMEIAEGAYEPTGRLPSEAKVVERFGVSRVTVRLALEQLEKDGLIERRKGKGTFVSGKHVRHRIDTLRSFHESLRLQGLEATMRIEELATVATPPDLVAHFGPRCALLERSHFVSGEVIALGRSLLPEAIAAAARQEAERLPTYALLDDPSRGGIAAAEVEIGARPADARTAAFLGVPRGAILLVMERSSMFADGTRAERSEFFIRPERYRFVLGSRIVPASR